LFVAFAYHGADRDSETRGLLERFESPSTRGHRIVHRDHYANPRSLPYLIAMIVEAAAILTPHAAPDLVVDRRYEGAIPDEVAKSFGRVNVAAIAGPREAGQDHWIPSSEYDHVVLVYADALGLGCEDAERRVLEGRWSVFVLNGRRRLFDRRGIDARLRLSRFLAQTRIVERGLSWLVGPLGVTLSAWDRVAGRAND
jgi:hypothetical protein